MYTILLQINIWLEIKYFKNRQLTSSIVILVFLQFLSITKYAQNKKHLYKFGKAETSEEGRFRKFSFFVWFSRFSQFSREDLFTLCHLHFLSFSLSSAEVSSAQLSFSGLDESVTWTVELRAGLSFCISCLWPTLL